MPPTRSANCGEALRCYRPRFTRQFVTAGSIADIACRKARLAIELDGGQHAESSRDSARTARLEQAGWKVLRFWNSDVLSNRDGVVEGIFSTVAERLLVFRHRKRAGDFSPALFSG
jgi:very-short-patch-repair endonuclease